jgi:hypothetical protein
MLGRNDGAVGFPLGLYPRRRFLSVDQLAYDRKKCLGSPFPKNSSGSAFIDRHRWTLGRFCQLA